MHPAIPRSKGRSLLYMGILIVAMLLIVEGAARLMYAFTSKTWGLTVPPHIGQLHPTLGWALKPGASGTSKRTGYPIHYAINSKGLRDVETTYEKPANTTRIVLLGDSRTFGFGVPIEKHFSMLIEGYFRDGKVECINMGVDGYGVDQELLFLRQEGFKYQPDFVIALVSHFGNHRHMHDMRWNMGKPRFILQEDGELKLTNSPVTNNKSWYVTLRRLDRLASNSMAYTIVRDLILRLAVTAPATPVQAATIPEGSHDTARLSAAQPSAAMEAKASPTNPPPSIPPGETTADFSPPANNTGPGESASEFDPNATRPPGLTDEEWDYQRALYSTALAILKTMDEETAAHNATFVLATQMPELCGLAELYDFRCVDVTVPMQNEGFPLPDGLDHFNESGNGVLAWQVVQYLHYEGLLPHPGLSKSPQP